MSKVATRYLDCDPWTITETGFHPDRALVSESIFSLANEYMGVRGYFDEGYGGERLVGSYLNGVFEEADIHHPAPFKGLATISRFMVNTVDWLHTRIAAGKKTLDLADAKVEGFVRTLNMREGTLTRRFTWKIDKKTRLTISFQRFLSMVTPQLGCQRIAFACDGAPVTVRFVVGLDFSQPHVTDVGRSVWTVVRSGEAHGLVGALGRTERSGHRVFSAFRLTTSKVVKTRPVKGERLAAASFSARLGNGRTFTLDRLVVTVPERDAAVKDATVWSAGVKAARSLTKTSYDEALAEHRAWWERTWEGSDIRIDGDLATQQGVRFSIFQLHQTYHGVDPGLNVGAKGLTGEVYNGHTFWDTETYCLPFYMFNNPGAARNLLGYRYATLPQAIERASELDCRGARYPMSTIDGTESCGVWQHGDLEIHISVAVAYGVWHYVRVTGDTEFLHREGIEMLLEIARYYASRGQWSPDGEFGFYGVMGADEFHMMVHNNAYTNVMVKRMIEYTLAVAADMRRESPEAWKRAVDRTGLEEAELDEWRRKAERIRVLFDAGTKLFEQHDGYFDLPHIGMDEIPHTEFPLYKHWAYVRIFRYDMIKQPDVLLLLFFFSHSYGMDVKRANFEYYEKRCVHESSLSPGVHSILAAELGEHDLACDYWQHAARLDLDDYNRNTHEGLHTTSMAACWMNVVYGFGGMRSDGERLSFAPSLPASWAGLSFRILYRGATLSVAVDRDRAAVRTLSGPDVEVDVFGERHRIDATGVELPLPAGRRTQ